MVLGTSLSVPITAIPFPGSTWSGVIAVTISGGTSGLTLTPASFSVDTTKVSGETVTVTSSASVATGVYSFTITGTSGSMVASAQLAVAVVQAPPPATSAQANVLYSFTGQQDGGDPTGALISDSAGNLYGVTALGGAYSAGVVFELSFLNGAWKETVLHSFGNGTDGVEPVGALVFDGSGNLYGVTALGGNTSCSEGCGTVYELTPTVSGWQETIMHSFTGGADGNEPGAGLVLDKAGNLYGTSRYGGYANNTNCSGGCGTVFTLVPSVNGWAHSVIYNFQGSADGWTPHAALIMDPQGSLYGTTEGGGYYSTSTSGNAICLGSCGTIFKMTPSGGAWQETVLYSFQGLGIDGVDPTGLVMDSAGNLYGATTIGGFTYPPCSGSVGNFFKLNPTGSGGSITQLYYFMGCERGYSPLNVIRDQAGNVYGVGSGGSLGCDSNSTQGCGTVFQLSQTTQGWVESAYYDFPGGDSGWWPNSVTLVGGSLYGTTSQGGPSNYGVIFEITP
jgi:uncharacterized repeat protein (TIGR03803 family)